MIRNMEKYHAIKNGNLGKHNKKWHNIQETRLDESIQDACISNYIQELEL